MSETVRYKGKLTPTGKTLKEYDPNVEDIDDLYPEAIEIDGLVYVVNKKRVCDDYDIFNSTGNDDGTIDFEVMYHNGGCGFNEAIGSALKNKR